MPPPALKVRLSGSGRAVEKHGGIQLTSVGPCGEWGRIRLPDNQP